jgi:hypothetical protein
MEHTNVTPTLAASIPVVLDRFHEQNGDRITTYTFGIAEEMSRNLTMDGLHPTFQGHEVELGCEAERYPPSFLTFRGMVEIKIKAE